MLHLLAPAGLLGLMALAVPAVLHLRRPPPPTVRVGSLRYLDALPRRRVRWWRWRDLLRLALRLALLTLLTLALAGPEWRRASSDLTPRRWALVDPSGTPTGPSLERLEQRRAAGDEVRLLTDGYAEIPSGAPVTSSGEIRSVDLWSRLRELDARLPPGSRLTVFSPARLGGLRGERPTLERVTVDWVETPSSPAASTRLEKLESLPDGQIIGTLGTGDGNGLARTRSGLNVPAGSGTWVLPVTGSVATVAITHTSAGAITGRVSAPASDAPTAAIPVRPMRSPRVVIFHTRERAADSRRLEAAIRAAAPPGMTTPEAVVLVNPAGDTTVPAAPDWVFCLGGARPEVLAENAGIRDATNLFTDAGDSAPVEGDTAAGVLVTPELAGRPGVILRRRTSLAVDANTFVAWRDGRGTPVLTVARSGPTGGTLRWRFGGRFDPAWNDLTASTALPEILRAWFFPPTEPDPDPRLARAAQAEPRRGTVAAATGAAWPFTDDDLSGGRTGNLRPWALALAAVGFLLERVWSLRRPTIAR